MPIKIKHESSSEIRKEYHLNSDAIIELLNKRVKLSKGETPTEVIIRIPSGGDYSGMNLEIDDDCPVIVKTVIRENRPAESTTLL